MTVILLEKIIEDWKKLPIKVRQVILAPFKFSVDSLLAGKGNAASMTSVLTMIYLIEAAESCKVIQGSKALTQRGRLVYSLLRYKENAVLTPDESDVLTELMATADMLINAVSNLEYKKIEKRYKGLIGSDRLKKLPHPEQKHYNHTSSLIIHERKL